MSTRTFGCSFESLGSNNKSPCFSRDSEGGVRMYGYIVQAGFMGLVDGRWMLFATEADYIDYISEE